MNPLSWDLANPTNFRDFYQYVCTYHWLVTRLENRGIPQTAIDELRKVERLLEIKALGSPCYSKLADQIQQQIAKNHGNEQPPNIRHQEHRWVVSTQNPKTYGEISHSYRSLVAACTVFTNFGIEPDAVILIVVGTIELLNFLTTEFIDLAEELTGQFAAKYG